MFRLLDELQDQGERSTLREKGYELVAMLMQDQDVTSLLPRGFMDFATQVYLSASQKSQYYLSCEELLWLSECARSNVIVAKSEAG